MQIILIMATGYCREEIIGLKRNDLDFDNSIIDISKTILSKI